MSTCNIVGTCNVVHTKNPIKINNKIENVLMEKFTQKLEETHSPISVKFEMIHKKNSTKKSPKLVKISIVQKKIHTKITMICENLLIQKWQKKLRKLIHQFQ